MNQRHIHEPFILAAMGIALTVGFGYAAVIIAVYALRLPMGAWWMAMVQAHGHAQLFGWVGLFIVGVGLFFLPRLRGTLPARIELAPWSLAGLCAGIVLRAICQPMIPLGAPFDALGRLGTMASGILELIGVGLFMTMLIASFRRARPITRTAPIVPVRPYLVLALTSFVMATLLNAALALASPTLFPFALNRMLTNMMIYGFIIPMTIVFAVRNLPLFMRLAAPSQRNLWLIGVPYISGLVLRIIEQPFWLSVGQVLLGGALLFFIAELDVLMRRKPPWTSTRTLPPPDYVETRPPTRPHYPDYGEFGRFELLILSAFGWLAFASLLTVIDGLSTLLGYPALLNPDIERHTITVGFITLLILGMAVRLVPGFSGQRRIASPRLVLATFWLGNLATLTRVVPLLAPEIAGLNIILGFSGIIGWLAVAGLGINLWQTFRQ